MPRIALHAWILGSLIIAPAQATPVAKVATKIVADHECIANGDLERTAKGRVEAWPPYDQGYAIEHGKAHGGNVSAVCDNPDGQQRLGLSQTLTLNRPDIRPLFVSGWSKADGVEGSPDANYALYVDILYQDGTPLWAQIAPFSCGSHDWEYRQFRIIPDKPVKQITVNALFRGRKGKVWFDDISLKEAPPNPAMVMFEGAAVELARPRCKEAVAAGPEIHVRDVGAESSFFLARNAKGRDGRIEIPELQLAVTSRTSRANGCRRMEITVEDLAKRDRAITVYYVLPLNAKDWRWFDNVRETRRIEPNGVYQYVSRTGVGAIGATSRYPFACVAGPKRAYSLIVPEPRVCHLTYHARVGEFYAAFDIGLTQDSRTPGTASVVVCDAETPPELGMRATAQRFCELLPQYFDTSRVPKRQGNWMAFSKISSVQGPEDFGFAVHEGDNDVRWDNAHGVGAYVYVEPMTWWMAMPAGVPRTYAGALECLQSFQKDLKVLNAQKGSNSELAWAVALSCVFDPEGRYRVDLVRAPWCDGAVFGNSADPDVPERDGHLNLAHLNLRKLEKAMKDAEAEGGLAGIYLDSLEGWGMMKNFRREHFAAADLPLTFDFDTRRPIVLNAFSTQEWTEFIAKRTHERGKLLMANAVPHEFPFLALPLDLMGTETQWQRDGKFAPPDAGPMYLRRTLAWHKPYMFLMNTHFETWTAAMTERYMQICTFYGMFSGFFSENAATNVYFANPAWYNRDRELFRRYMPVIRRVAEAGWEPITSARSDSDDVWVERWGTAPASGLYFTVMNAARQARHVEIAIDVPGTSGQTVRALLGGTTAGRAPRLRLDVAAEGVEVLAVGVSR